MLCANRCCRSVENRYKLITSSLTEIIEHDKQKLSYPHIKTHKHECFITWWTIPGLGLHAIIKRVKVLSIPQTWVIETQPTVWMFWTRVWNEALFYNGRVSYNLYNGRVSSISASYRLQWPILKPSFLQATSDHTQTQLTANYNRNKVPKPMWTLTAISKTTGYDDILGENKLSLNFQKVKQTTGQFTFKVILNEVIYPFDL